MAFLITGYPRTRTAWLSALFTGGLVECRHDAFVSFGCRQRAAFWAHSFPGHGISDPSAACAWPIEAIELFNEDPKVFLKRDFNETVRSFEKWSGIMMTIEQKRNMLNNAQMFLEHAPRLMVIESSSLSDDSVVQEIFHFCTGKILDPDKIEMFQNLHIEQHFSRVAEKVNLKEFVKLQH